MESKKMLLFMGGALLSGLLGLACATAPTNSNGGTNSGGTAKVENTNAGTPADIKPAAHAGVNFEAVAERLVTENARIKEGEIVLINGGLRDRELLEAIAVNVRKQGGHPLLFMNSEQMSRRMWTDVPEKYDAQEPKLGLKLADMIDATITVDSNETENLLADIASARRAARAAAGRPVGDVFERRNVRSVNLGNALYPTEWLAKRHGMSQEELAKAFWAGINVSAAEIQAKGEALRKALETGKELHITNTSGTDLTVKIEGRPIFFSDGFITDEEAKKGGRDINIWLPAGDVYFAPVAGTANGTVVIARDFYQGKEIKNLRITFKDGKVISIKADSGDEQMQADYAATSDPNKSTFAFLDFGVNPAVRLAAGDTVGAWMPAGMVTVGIGDNTWTGGTNKSPYGYSAFMPGSTIKLDGREIIVNGELKL